MIVAAVSNDESGEVYYRFVCTCAGELLGVVLFCGEPKVHCVVLLVHDPTSTALHDLL